MSLLFKSHDLRPVLAEAIKNRCKIVLVKDHGVYFLSQRGARNEQGRQKLLAYAVGCNPDIDPFDDWWHRAEYELGGDDFAEYFDPDDGVFKAVMDNCDLSLTATPTQIILRVVNPFRQ